MTGGPARRLFFIGLLVALSAVLGWWVAINREPPADPLRMGMELTAGVPKSVDLKDMTWVEVRSAVRAGVRTVLVPTGGIEQNGPHMILGKHDYLVAWAADRIALGVGHTLVAPVISYVPEGRFHPADGHLRFPGTIGLSDAGFAAVLDGVARSLKLHGFTLICFMGDHGASQPVQKEVADRLTREWRDTGVRVVQLDAYYQDGDQIKALEGAGENLGTIGSHASLIDTAELMAVHPAGVDLSRLPSDPARFEETGSSGDPARANAALGRRLIEMRIEAAIAAIRRLREAP